MYQISKVSLVLATKVFGALLSFLVTFLVVKEVPLEDSGIFFFTYNSILILVAFSTFGLQSLALKGFSGSSYRDVSGFSYLNTSAVIGLVAVSMTYWYLSDYKIPNGWLYIYLLITSIGGLQIISMIFQGRGRSTLSLFVQNLFSNLLFSVVLYFFDFNDVSDLLKVYTLINLLIYLMSCMLYRIEFKPSSQWSLKSDLINGKNFLLINVLSQVLMLGGGVVSNVNLSDVDFSILSVCMRIAAVMNFLVVSINFVFSPYLVRLNESEPAKVGRIVLSVSLLSSFISLLMLFLIMGYSSSILEYFGDEYVSAAGVLFILLVSQITVSILGVGGQYLVLTGRERVIRDILLVSSIFSLVISYSLSYFLGLYGAALGISLSIAFQNLFVVYLLFVSRHEFFRDNELK